MRNCPGELYLRPDGAVAYCTEELHNRRCPGADAPHSGGYFRFDQDQEAALDAVDRQDLSTPRVHGPPLSAEEAVPTGAFAETGAEP